MTSHVGAALLALATALSDTDDLCMKDLPRADTTDPSAQARALTTCYERACATGDRNACDALTRIREEEWKTQYGAVRVGGQIKEPRRTRCVNLSADPQLAPRHGCYPLLLSVLIDTEGKVREAQIVTGVPQFRQAAVEAVKQWAYAPTTLEPGYGTAIPVIMTVTVPCPPAEACAVAHGCRGSSSAVRRKVVPTPSPSPTPIPNNEHVRPTRRGLTWGRVSDDKRLRTVLVSCHGLPRPEGGDCNAHHGDTACTERLPILCIKPDGSPRPAYATVGTAHAMSREYYQGWAGGRVALTRPIAGTQLRSLAVADALCEAARGHDYRMAEFHDGKYVEGMDADSFYGKTWPPSKALHSGGWAFHAYGKLAKDKRFWVRINDQPANCWDGNAPKEAGE